MLQLTKLKEEDERRRSMRAGLAAGALVAVVAVIAFFTFGHNNSTPAPKSAPAVTQPTPDPAVTVGSYTTAGITGVVPAGWTVGWDRWDVYLEQQANLFLDLGGPVTQVLDPKTGKEVAAPADFAAWLRNHPWLTVDAERQVIVDGQRATQLDLTVTGPDEFPIFCVTTASQECLDFSPFESFTETVMTVDGKTVLLVSGGAIGTTSTAVLTAGTAKFLASLRLP